MKDVAHHLKYIQKKVIQFARKEAAGLSLAESSRTTALLALEESGKMPRRKRRLFNQLPQAARFQ